MIAAEGNPLNIMLTIARLNPAYQKADTAYFQRLFLPAVQNGKVEWFGDLSQGLISGFFTHFRPLDLIPPGRLPIEPMWRQNGPYLWICDAAGIPGEITGMQLGKGMRQRVRELGLAEPGETVIFRRQTGRYGRFIVR